MPNWKNPTPQNQSEASLRAFDSLQKRMLFYDYTPAWAATIAAPSIGNGTLTGRYCRIGSWCTFAVFLAFGSTTGGGGGTFSFTLPFTAVNYATLEQHVLSHCFVTGSVSYQGLGYIPSASTVVYPYFSSSATDTRLQAAKNSQTGAVGEGIPLVAGNYTWTTGTNLFVGGTYEIDPSS